MSFLWSKENDNIIIKQYEGVKLVTMKTEDGPQSDDYVTLYRRAFEKYGTRALWSSRPVPNPTCADALAITRSLRVEGDLNARRLAEQIERACLVSI